MLRQGLAKTYFSNAYQRAPWLSSKKKQEPQWPFLDNLLAQKRLPYLDYVLVHRLLRNNPEAGQEVALFLCHLALAAKEGHLCVYATSDGIQPSVDQLWQNEEAHALPKEEVQLLTQSILKGAQKVPAEVMITLQKDADPIPQHPICRDGNNFYFQRYWIFETLFLKYLKKLLKTTPGLELDSEKIKQTIQPLLQEKILLKEQAQAIEQGCLNSFTLVTGGPGTGKTYTAGHLIKIFWQNLSEEQKKYCQVVLAAPTGKAAANLQHSLGRVTKDLEGFPPIQAKTLHSLLGIKQNFAQHEMRRLTADLVVVDESSMIDIRMMACLFESLKPGSRLILLGDKHQLPSVEAGSVFVDLIHLGQNYPHLNIPCISLAVCMRAELKSLIDFAQLVNQGLAQDVLDYLKQSHGEEIKRLHFAVDKKIAQREFLMHVLPYFASILRSGVPPEGLLDLFQSIRLLSPLRKGLFGVESLNQLIWQKLCQNAPTQEWIAIPIMVVANDYRQELFNGETGVLIRRFPLRAIGIEDYALFPSRQEGKQVRRLSALLLPRYELAYCLSVHKSQGSEFERVVLVLPEGSELFGREVFYTALTRARKFIEIYGADEVILKTVMQQGIRLSGIEERLKN